MTEDFSKFIDPLILNRSGSVFYSGRKAFGHEVPLYILGLNPGGSPVRQHNETINNHLNWLLQKSADNWSAYRDDVWLGRAAGTYGMQPRVLHMFRRLAYDPGTIPSSNLIFVRTNRENAIGGEKQKLIDLCWSFHQAVISKLKPKVIVCFGKTAGDTLGKRLNANQHVGRFVESNGRKWITDAYKNSDGIVIVKATHPSIADWTSMAADPTSLIRSLL